MCVLSWYDFSSQVARIAIDVPCTNMDLVVDSICNSIYIIDEQDHFGHKLSVCISVFMEETPYEICGRNQCLLTIFKPNLIVEMNTARSVPSSVVENIFNCKVCVNVQ